MNLRRVLHAFLFVLVLAPFAVHLTGCSILGLGIGAVMDSQRPRRDRMIPSNEVGEVRSGSFVEFRLRDSSVVVGKFLGVDQDFSAGYAERYAAWRAGPDSAYRAPALGEEVRLVERSRRSRIGRFAGFGYRSALLERMGKSPQIYLFEDLIELRTADKTRIKVERFAELEAEGRLPTRVGAWVARPSASPKTAGERWLGHLKRERPAFADTVEVSADELRWVRASSQSSAARTGLYIGLTADLVGLAVVLSAASASSSPGCDLSGVTFGPGYYYSSDPRPYDRHAGHRVAPGAPNR